MLLCCRERENSLLKSTSSILHIQYLAEGRWTPDHHTFMCDLTNVFLTAVYRCQKFTGTFQPHIYSDEVFSTNCQIVHNCHKACFLLMCNESLICNTSETCGSRTAPDCVLEIINHHFSSILIGLPDSIIQTAVSVGVGALP